jgi:hypothetical protein
MRPGLYISIPFAPCLGHHSRDHATAVEAGIVMFLNDKSLAWTRKLCCASMCCVEGDDMFPI